MSRYRSLFKISLALAASLTLTALLTGSAAADTDLFLDVNFHSFTLDGGNSTCVPYDDSDVGQTRNCDPVNLIFPGRTWQEVRDLLSADGWSDCCSGSGQSLHYDDGAGLYAEAEQLVKPATYGDRAHIRLWQAPGDTLVTLAAVHHEELIFLSHVIDMDWELAEAAVAGALCDPNCEQAYLPTQDNIQGKDGEWRGWGNNGSATVIPAPGTPDDPPTITIISPAADSTVTGVTPVAIQASDDHDPAGSLNVQWRIDGGGWQPTGYNASSGLYEATWDPATAADGSHLLQAQAMDSAANTAGASHNVIVDKPNQSPTASFTFSCSNLSCDFDGSASSDPDGTIAAYAWDFGDGYGGTGATPNHVYVAAGTYHAVLTITDNEGATGTDEQDVTVSKANYLPLAIFYATCAGLSCDFNASASSDPDGTIVDYAWDFGDGNGRSGNSATTSHTYASGGSYNVTLTVTDNDGGVATDSQQVTVAGSPASTMHVGDLAGLSIVNKNWRAEVIITVHDDGEGLVSGATVNGSWSGDTSGTSSCTTDGGGTCTVSTAELPKKTAQTVIFTVTGVAHDPLVYEAPDNHDPQGDSSGTAIQVNKDGSTQDPGTLPAQSPVANFTFDCPDLSCSFDASSSYDPDGGDIVHYDWDFGDGSTALNGGAIINHAYLSAGSWSVRLTVTDDEGQTNGQTQTVSVGQSGAITLTAVGYKVRAIQHVDLTWGGVDSSQVDIYRDGSLIDTWPTNTSYTDNLGVKRGGPYAYQVCEAGSTAVCSELVAVEF